MKTPHVNERRARAPKQESLTTEQLAEKTLQDVKQMSPQEKLEARKHLDVASGNRD